MERIDRDLRRELKRLGPGGAIQDVTAAWPAAVGPEIARNAWPARISRDGTLHVATASSTWAFELGQLAGDIAARLAEHLQEAPRTLRFAPGRLPEPAAAPPAETAKTSIRPDAEALSHAATLVNGVADPELRELIARAAAASLAKGASDRRF